MVDMNPTLAQALLAKGVIRHGTIVQAYQNVRGLSCECDSQVLASFVVNRARLIGGRRVVFDAIDIEQITYAMRSEQIIMVDGMPIDRIAYSHNLTLDGVEIIGRSRRGRRKIRMT